jgi:hypothetical protein
LEKLDWEIKKKEKNGGGDLWKEMVLFIFSLGDHQLGHMFSFLFWSIK